MAVVAVLITVGLVLLFLETFLPGLIAGALGFLALAAAVGYAYINLGIRGGNTTLVIVLFLLVIGAILWVKFFPDSAIAQTFVSKSSIGTVHAEKPDLLGQTGVAFTDLRPAGTALLDGKRVDVVTEGAFIEKGRNLKVVAVEGMRVVVRQVESEIPPV